jgi:hypothetical protein
MIEGEGEGEKEGAVPQSFVRDSRQDELIITDVGMREVF